MRWSQLYSLRYTPAAALALGSLVAGTIRWRWPVQHSPRCSVFTPCRRVQEFVERRFDRSRYDAGVVDEFASRLRQEVDLDGLTTDLTAGGRAALRPVTVSLWLRNLNVIRRWLGVVLGLVSLAVLVYGQTQIPRSRTGFSTSWVCWRLPLPVVGAYLVWRLPGNPVGWILAGFGLTFTLGVIGEDLALTGGPLAGWEPGSERGSGRSRWCF